MAYTGPRQSALFLTLAKSPTPLLPPNRSQLPHQVPALDRFDFDVSEDHRVPFVCGSTPGLMVAVVGSVAFPLTPRASRTARSAALTSVSRAALSGQKAVLQPEIRGLKVSCVSRTAAAVGVYCGRPVLRGSVACEAQRTSASEVPKVSKSTWRSLVTESDRMVLVSFWAPWCGPCRMMHPILVDVAAEYEGKVHCFELNTDDNPDIATQYKVRSIPTIVLFKDGEKKYAIVGAVTKNTLQAAIQRFM